MTRFHRIAATFLCVVFAAALAGAAEEYPLAEAKELRPRGGLPNFFAKLKAGGEVRVGYIGGSITAANGWRPKTTAWLGEQYPNAKIVETNAAIGGTGSDLGVFRIGRDILQHKPDLVFIEFAVNDGGAEPAQIQRAMEGMVRQVWRQNPATDICFVYTMAQNMVPELSAGKFPRSASAMEAVADHYGIPTIHMGLEAIRMLKEDKLIFKAAAPRTEEEKKAAAGKMIFSADGVHPHAETGHQLYLEAVARCMKQLKTVGTAARHALVAPLRADNYEQAKMIPIAKAKRSGAWEKPDPAQGLGKNFAKFMPEMYAARQPGMTVTVKFKGTTLSFMDLLGPDCGQVEVTVDGGKPAAVKRFDSYCTYHRIGTLGAARNLPEGVHTVQVTLTDADFDKAAILATRNNQKIDNPKRLEGKNWYVGWIMLVGDLIE